ncbi:hypothetical protein EL22_28725 [Halostagnicola sp. A56]|nr:hypothetical protein EL22_28725 [Halostagnicola sp. A56]
MNMMIHEPQFIFFLSISCVALSVPKLNRFQRLSLYVRRIRSIAAGLRDSGSSLWNGLTWYSWGKTLFWIATLLPTLFVFNHIYLENTQITSLLTGTPEQPFFSDSLILMVNLIGFVFTISIFLIQNTVRSYTPNLAKEIFRDGYLRGIFVSLLGIAVFNLSSLYFQVGGVYQPLSFIFALSSFLYLVALALITAYYLNISNTISRSEERIKSKITEDNIYRSQSIAPVKNDEFLEELSNETLLITNTGLMAIDNNDHELVVKCIQSLESIGVEYLEKLQSPVDDDFMRELNDQFEFLIQSASEEYS